MRSLTRVYFFLGAALILCIFYFTSRSSTPPLQNNSSDARQAVWAEIEPERPIDKDWLPKHDNQMHFQERLSNDNLNPYPLGERYVEEGVAAAARGKNRPGQVVHAVTRPHAPAVTAKFETDVFDFQKDLNLTQPRWDVERLLRFNPHRWAGRGKPTFATFFCSRNSSLADPYFLATQQLIYRVLWDPATRSKKHPFTVFVAPFISQQQREIFAASGALVRQLDLVPWNPTVRMWDRLRDMFSKLNMWGQTDFERIAFLDSDAFPVKNIDGIFDVAKKQTCKADLLPGRDARYARHICGYTFAASPVALGHPHEINAGVLVFNPNRYMHERLLRDSQRTDEYDNSVAEQGFLNKAFARDGPFPMQTIPHEWNGFLPQENQKETLFVVHEKLWIFGSRTTWTTGMFNATHDRMVELYESREFDRIRVRDGRRR